MITRKHFEAIAQMLNERVSDIDAYNPASPDEAAHNGARLEALSEIAGDLARFFASENPRFDRERFIAACGL